MFDAIGKTEPIALESSVDSSLPSRTAATKTSVASDAPKVSEPYAFIADVARSATVAVSPSPTAAACKDAFKTFIACSPSKPADVIKNNASAASLAERPVSVAICLAVSPILATSSPAIPTRDSIFVIDLSKSAASLIDAPPAKVRGNVKLFESFVPIACALVPKDFKRALVLFSADSSCEESPVNMTFNVFGMD